MGVDYTLSKQHVSVCHIEFSHSPTCTMGFTSTNYTGSPLYRVSQKFVPLLYYGGEDQKSFNKAGKMVLRRLDTKKETSTQRMTIT